MSVKYVKVRFNLDKPDDRAAFDVLKKAKGQNMFIKNAILTYDSRINNETLVDSILSAMRAELSKVQFASPFSSTQPSETDKDAAEASADIADAFLESL